MERYECVKCGGDNIVKKSEFGLTSFYCLDCHHNFFKRSNDEEYDGKISIVGFLSDDNVDYKDKIESYNKSDKPIVYKKNSHYYLMDYYIIHEDNTKSKYFFEAFRFYDNTECKMIFKNLAKLAKKNKKCMVLIINKNKGPIIHNIQAIKTDEFWDTVMSYIENGKDVCIGVYDGPYGMNTPTINPIHAIFLSSKTFPKVFTTNMIKLLKEED